MKTSTYMGSCPLCNAAAEHQQLIDSNNNRQFVKCHACELVYVPENNHVTISDEKLIYDYHENNPSDLGYRKFLSKLAVPLNHHLTENCIGLDFGCGPGPTLSLIMEEHGHTMHDYDPLYRNNRSLLEQQYDFVCATEVVEHFREASNSFDEMMRLVKPKGIVGLMTKLNPGNEPFSSWHYTRDKTHICFYHRETINYIASRYRCKAEIIGNDVIILKKCE